MALTIDLAPTFLGLAGLTPAPAIDGRSLVPVLNSAVADWRRSFLIEYTSDIVFPRIVRMGYDAVRTERVLMPVRQPVGSPGERAGAGALRFAPDSPGAVVAARGPAARATGRPTFITRRSIRSRSPTSPWMFGSPDRQGAGLRLAPSTWRSAEV